MANGTPIYKQSLRDNDNNHTSRIPVLGPYLQNLSEVVNKLLVAEPAGQKCYALVDGSNVIYHLNGELKLKQAPMLEAMKCLPPSLKSQVIVVWTQWMWDKYGLGAIRPDTVRAAALRRKKLACLFEPLRAKGTSVYFALVQYPRVFREEGTVWLPNGEAKSQSWCKLPGMRQQPNHLACELDDAILTALHCEITRNNRCARAVSDDRRVLKDPREMMKLNGWVEEARQNQGFEVVTTIVKVDTEGGCASLNELSV